MAKLAGHGRCMQRVLPCATGVQVLDAFDAFDGLSVTSFQKEMLVAESRDCRNVGCGVPCADSGLIARSTDVTGFAGAHHVGS